MSAIWQECHFAHPWLLAFGPLLCWAASRRRRPEPRRAVTVPSIVVWRGFGRPVEAGRRPIDWLRLVILLLMLVALARPQLRHDVRTEHRQGIDVVLVVDASRSMETQDFDAGNGARISRLAALRRVLTTFAAARPNDRLGMIAFAERPYLVSPLTLDHEWLPQALGDLRTDLGTAIGSGLDAGLDLLAGGRAAGRVLLLVTDGLNTSGPDPLAVARRATDEGVRIHVIEAVRPEQHAGIELEASPLAAIARAGGGLFFQAPDAAALGAVYASIDRLEQKRLEGQRQAALRELFGWPLGAALVLLGGGMWRAGRSEDFLP